MITLFLSYTLMYQLGPEGELRYKKEGNACRTL